MKRITFLITLIILIVLSACNQNDSVEIPTPQPSQETIVSYVTPTEIITSRPLLDQATETATKIPTATDTTETEPPVLAATNPIIEEITTPIETPTQVIEMTPSPIPTSTPLILTYSCLDIDANWGNDWNIVIAALEQLIVANQNCGEESLPSKKYAAHFTYAASLENSGNIDGAIAQYQAALLTDPERPEALNELTRLNALPEPTPAACESTSAPLPDPAPPTKPDTSQFIYVQGDQLFHKGELFKTKGVNYYPRHAPWYQFINKADVSEMATELDIIKQAGFNTIRVFLRYEPLFTCQPEDAIPNEAAFAKIDKLFELAGERHLKLIVTLNDLPDLTFRPLYTDWNHHDAQTVYIVRRYRNNPNILAWDLRNEGDLDYGIRPNDDPHFTQEQVITWLAHISQLVQEHDPHHLLTAGWWGDPTVTSPYVDILSFHHWSTAEQLQARIQDYKQRNDKPLMLQELGYHSWADAPHGQRDGTGQADILVQTVSVTEAEDISGWIIWTAFDFVPEPGKPHNYEHYFGLWQTNLTPKPALQVLPLQ